MLQELKVAIDKLKAAIRDENYNIYLEALDNIPTITLTCEHFTISRNTDVIITSNKSREISVVFTKEGNIEVMETYESSIIPEPHMTKVFVWSFIDDNTSRIYYGVRRLFNANAIKPFILAFLEDFEKACIPCAKSSKRRTDNVQSKSNRKTKRSNS